MNPFRIDVRSGQATAGDTVSGGIIPEEDTDCRELTIRLVYLEVSHRRGELERYVVDGERVVLSTRDLRRGEWLPFNLALPDDARPNLVSPHGKVEWRLIASVDQRGLDESQSQVVDVIPARLRAVAPR